MIDTDFRFLGKLFHVTANLQHVFDVLGKSVSFPVGWHAFKERKNVFYLACVR